MTTEFLILLFAKVYFWTYLGIILVYMIAVKKEDREECKRNAIKYGRHTKINIFKVVLFIMSAYIYFNF